jgi:hypothetical protein
VKFIKIIGKTCKPKNPPPLPGDRVQDFVPFSVTIINFAGSLQIKDDSKARKIYICLFTCVVVRAIRTGNRSYNGIISLSIQAIYR